MKTSNSTLKFPNMIEASLRQTNNFWAKVFENLAFGKAPPGCFITSSSFLVCKSKGCSFSYFLNNDKSADELSCNIVEIFTKKLNYMSIQDRVSKLNSFLNVKNRLKRKYLENQWTDFKKKKHKEQLVASYVIRLTENNPDVVEKQVLLSVIYMGLIFKKIASQDIDIENGEIENIQSLVKCKNEWKISESKQHQLKKTASRSFPKKKTLRCLWNGIN